VKNEKINLILLIACCISSSIIISTNYRAITKSDETQSIGNNYMWLAGYLPYEDSYETHEFPNPVTSFYIQDFYWEGAYTELEIQIWCGDVLKDNEHWAAGENGGYVPFRYYQYPATHITIVYYSYFGDEFNPPKGTEPPEVSYMGYCEWPDVLD